MSKKYKSKKIIVNRQYQILALILVMLAGGLVLLPKHTKNEGISPQLFVKNGLSTERYISTDKLADRMINQDPTLLLVDIRSEKEYDDYSLPNAINIPLAKFFDEDLNAYVNQDVYDVILYSNDNFYSNEAWMLGNRNGYQHLYVLKGGLNEWFNTIINPTKPVETDAKKEFELYSFRKAAGMYFGVGVVKSDTEKKPAKKVITVKKKKKRVAEGGC
ncbi:MAG: rhodanese-like domain-containing protein [Flavobacteriaceae bacterium]